MEFILNKKEPFKIKIGNKIYCVKSIFVKEGELFLRLVEEKDKNKSYDLNIEVIFEMGGM